MIYEGLEDVDWGRLTHAYGEAHDIPDVLCALASPDPEVQEHAFGQCYMGIYHQGSRYTATAAAIPFMIQALQHPEVPRKDAILELLAHLAVCTPMEGAIIGLDLPDWLAQNPFPRHDYGGVAFDYDAQEIERACYFNTAQGYPVYAELLEHDEVRVRISAALVLAWFPLCGDAVLDKLRGIADDDNQHDYSRASALLAISHIDGQPSPAPALSQDGPIPYLQAIRLICAVRTAESAESLQDALTDCLARGISAPEGDEDPYPDDPEPTPLDTTPFFPWGDIESLLRQALRCCSSSRNTTSLLQRLAEATDEENAYQLAKAAIEKVFGTSIYNSMHFCDESSREFKELDCCTKRQRKAVRAIADCGLLWPRVAGLIRFALNLDFEPLREELQAAVKSMSKTQTPRSRKHEAPEIPEYLLAASVEELTTRVLSGGEPFLAARALGTKGPEAAKVIPQLAAAMLSCTPNTTRAFSLSQALEGIGEPALPAVLELLLHPNLDVAHEAARAFPPLAQLSVEAFQDCLGHPDAKIRRQALIKLQFQHDTIDSERAIHFARIAGLLLGDFTEDVADRAEWALNKMGASAIPAVEAACQHANTAVRARAFRIVGELKDVDGAQLISPLLSGLSDAESATRVEAICSLGALDCALTDPVFEGIEAALDDPDWEVRQFAATVLGHRSMRSGLALLTRFGKEPDALVRYAIAVALRRCPAPAEAQRLHVALQGEPELAIRRLLLWALAECQGGAAVLRECAEIEELAMESGWLLLRS